MMCDFVSKERIKDAFNQIFFVLIQSKKVPNLMINKFKNYILQVKFKKRTIYLLDNIYYINSKLNR